MEAKVYLPISINLNKPQDIENALKAKSMSKLTNPQIYLLGVNIILAEHKIEEKI